MIKPKYSKNLDAVQLARAGVERAIGATLKDPTPKSPQSKGPQKKTAKGQG
jgi:hypothetical protein